MKKRLIYSLLLSLVITACGSSTPATPDVQAPALTFGSAQVQKLNYLNEKYELKDSLPIYYATEKGKVAPYVNVTEFMAFVAPEMSKDFSSLKNEVSNGVWTLKGEVKDDENDYEVSITLDQDKQTLTLSEDDAINSFIRSKSYDESNLEGITYNGKVISDTKSKTVNLNKHSMYLYPGIKEGASTKEDILVPLHLMNFLISGYDLEIIYNYDGSETYLYAVQTEELTDQAYSKTGKSNLKIDELKTLNNETKAFMGFIFNNFYGLSEFQDVSDYSKKIDNALPKDGDVSEDTIQNGINSFLIDLNDLHTSTYTQGYLNPDYDYISIIRNNKYLMDFYEGFRTNHCVDVPEGTTAKFYDIDAETVYIELYSFDGKVKETLDNEMPKYANYKNVYFDIRCNTGGYLNDVNHVLKYLSSTPWLFVTADLSGGLVETEIIVEGDFHIKRDYYLVTSSVTFSAANYIASIIKDNTFATIVGGNSSGGTAAVEITTLPDGTSFSRSSSSMQLENKQHQIVEAGINVDKKIDFSKMNSKDYEAFIRSIIEASKK